MNVLHLDEQRGWRGGEQQASWLIQGLAARGHRVSIAGRPKGKFLASEHGGSVNDRLPLRLRNEVDLWSAKKLAARMLQSDIEVVHAHTSHAHMVACIARMMAGRGKVVVSRRVSFRPKDGRLNRWKYSLPDRFISVSHKVDEVLADFGIDQRKRSVVHSSLDKDRVNVAPLSRQELGVPPNIPLLVTAGALVGHKDHATLLRAMPRVIEKFPSTRLLIAGEGELRRTLTTLIHDLDLESAVTLLGQRDDAPRLIRAADVYVSSSWSEGLGTSVLEALACEAPVVATVAGGVPEMVIDGKTGFLVPNRDPEALANAIVNSLTDRDAAKRQAAEGRAHVEGKFGVDRMVEGTIRVYEELLS